MTDFCRHCGAGLNLETEDGRGPGQVGVEIRGVYDGVLYWMCPFCRGAWHDWPKEYGRRFEIAESYVGMANVHAGITT